MAKPGNVDTLEKTITFLQKREGIDKALKIVRYTSRLVAAVSPAGSEAQKRFDALQSSVGTSRKAYRLGKFLQDVHALRKLKLQGLAGWLELVTYCGEGVYYFLDQFLWLMKTGVISKAKEKRIAKVSAYAEAAGYAANIILNLQRIAALVRQEQALVRALASQRALAILKRGQVQGQQQEQDRREQEQRQEQQEPQQETPQQETPQQESPQHETPQQEAQQGQQEQQQQEAQHRQGAQQGQQEQQQQEEPVSGRGGVPGITARQRRKPSDGPTSAGIAAAAGVAATAGVAAGVGAEAVDVCEVEGGAELARQLRLVRYNRLLRSAFVVQDLADALMALSDITDARYKSISHPVVLSLAGLVSAAVSTYKYWQAS